MLPMACKLQPIVNRQEEMNVPSDGLSFDVSVIGSLNMDFTIFTNKYPGIGETVIGSHFHTGFGGKGSNQAVAAKVLGCRVSFIGKVGSDDFGKRFKEHFRSIGVNADGIAELKDTNTGVAFVEVEERAGDNKIIVVPGANMAMSSEHVESCYAYGLLKSRVVVFQFEISPNAILRGMQLAKANNMVTVLNPAPPPDPDQQGPQVELHHLVPTLLALSDFCCPNEREALTLAEHHLTSWEYRGTTEELSPIAYKPILCWFAEQGVRYPIVTLGYMGLVALIDAAALPLHFTEDVELLEQVNLNGCQKSVVHIYAPVITKVVDTTGAGDCFVGSLAYLVACHPQMNIVEQLRRAVWLASQSVKREGTHVSYLSRRKLPISFFSSDTVFVGDGLG